MAEYLGINYNQKTSRKQKDGSIEVDAEFVRKDIFQYVTFRFLNDALIEKEFQLRCQRKIDNFISVREREMTDIEKSAAMIKYFEDPKNVTILKDDFINLTTKSITIAGAI